MGMTNSATWSAQEAIEVAYGEFSRRVGADVLWQAFDALMHEGAALLAEHAAWADDIDSYLQWPLNLSGADLVVWVSNARGDSASRRLLTHVGLRWWRARDDLMRREPGTRVSQIHVDGSTDHVSLHLLRQMLYRGAAPDTEPPVLRPSRGSRR